MQTTIIYEKIAQAWIEKKRHIWIEGGTAASKTMSVLQLLYLIAEHSKSSLLISIISESIPHIKRGCLRDFQKILGDLFNSERFNKTDLFYQFNKARIEFFSADDPSKQRGARRDILFLNELNNIPYDAYRELDARTRLCTIADWNPTSEFFFHEQGLANDPDSAYIHATYKDALEVVPPEVIKNILTMGERDPNWANIYLEGKIGKIEGLVYPFFEQTNQLPEGETFYGLDFGYSNNPSVLVKCVIEGNELYCAELIYEAGLTNDAIAHRIDELGIRRNYDEIFADAAEPKSIDEIHKYGFNIKPCPKGADSVEFGHQKINQYKQFWTRDSLNCIREQRNFRYIQDKDGKFTEKMTHNFSHCLIAGTLVTTKRGQIPIERVTTKDHVLTRLGWKQVNASGMTAPSEYVQSVYFSNGKVITGTPDHLIYANNKFKPLNSLRYGDILEVCGEKQSPTMAKDITGILKPQIGLTECISSQDPKQNDTYIGRYGLMFMGQSLKVMKYIIKTTILLITRLKTCYVRLRNGITSSIQLLIPNGGELGLETILGNINPGQMLGINQTGVGNGIVNTGGRLINQESPWTESVNNAGNPSKILQDNRQRDFVQMPVNPNGGGSQREITKLGYVSFAKRLSKLINIQKQKPVLVYVLKVSGVHQKRQPVFDLTIESTPEFYANSMLVHNSMDARRYALVGKLGLALSKPFMVG